MIVWNSLIIALNILTLMAFAYYRGYMSGVRYADRTWVEYLEETLE